MEYSNLPARTASDSARNYSSTTATRPTGNRGSAAQAIAQDDVAVALVGPDGRVRRASEALAELVGRPLNELAGMPFHDLAHPDDRTLLADDGRKQADAAEFRLINRDGQAVPGLLKVTALPAMADEQALMLYRFERQADQKATDRRVRRDKQQILRRIRAMFNYAPVPALLWRAREGRLTLIDVNCAADRLTDGKTGGIIGKSATELYADEPELLSMLQACRTGRFTPPFHTDYRFRSTGEVKPVRMTFVPLSPGRVVQYIEDLTEQQGMEQRCREHLEELVHVKQMAAQAQLMGTLMHEINQPLSAATGFVHAARAACERTAADSDLQGLLHEAVRETERATLVMGRMRDLFRGRQRYQTSIDLQEVADRVARLLRRDIEQHGACLITDAGDEPVVVHGDPVQVEQVVVNLVRNAIEAAADLPVPRRSVILSFEPRDDGRVEVAVIDRGPGLTADEAGRIFEPFFSTKTDGLGMGLSICQTIVESHGGKLSVECPEQGGCVFRFDLPYANVAADSAAA